MHLKCYQWMGMACLLEEYDHHHDHPKVLLPRTLKPWLHPTNQSPLDCFPKSHLFYKKHPPCITIMGQQPQVVMHINQGLCLVYIQVVSLYTMDEAIASPIPLCRRGVNHLRNHLHCKFMQMCDRGAIHVPPLNRTQHVLIFGCMQVNKDSMLTLIDVLAQVSS